ncbi:hypothetical protein [uncultured Ruegeria sp.]|uniref:hypothetical protein n=1 Tax=uncultured Ruegeria sp. TaxID=259304 RepID=UPI002627FA52|nr:hypothetical protein [uncultured Ruegeria sp.]
MNAPSNSFTRSVHVSSSQNEHGVIALKNLARNSLDHESASRKWFASLLWRAFPAPSENDLALKAARVLDVSPRQVKNWLRCQNDASLKYVTAVALIAGIELGLKGIGGHG